MKQILDETLLYTNKAGRLVRGGGCYYTTLDGHSKVHCAIGRCLLPQYATSEFEFNADPISDEKFKKFQESLGGFDNLLRPCMRGHPKAFWSDLQTLHDNNKFWYNSLDNMFRETKAKLTLEGKKYVAMITKKIQNHESDLIWTYGLFKISPSGYRTGRITEKEFLEELDYKLNSPEHSAAAMEYLDEVLHPAAF